MKRNVKKIKNTVLKQDSLFTSDFAKYKSLIIELSIYWDKNGNVIDKNVLELIKDDNEIIDLEDAKKKYFQTLYLIEKLQNLKDHIQVIDTSLYDLCNQLDEYSNWMLGNIKEGQRND